MQTSGIELRSEEEQKREAERQLKYIEEAREIAAELSRQLGRPLVSHIKSFGCQMHAKRTIDRYCRPRGACVL